MATIIPWRTAAGSCGFNLGDRPVEAAYAKGVALFAFENGLSSPERPFYSCVVTGQLTCGGHTLEEAKAAGMAEALKWGTCEADRRMSVKQFEAVVNDPTRLPEAHHA